MKITVLIKVAFFCKLLQATLATKTNSEFHEITFEVETLSRLLENVTLSNERQLDNYLVDKIFEKRYTDLELKDTAKIKEVVIKSLFPGSYIIKHNKTSNVNETYIRNKLTQEKLFSKGNFKSYLNGYLVKVNKTWKVRKVEKGEITYQNVEGSNFYELLEILYLFSRLSPVSTSKYARDKSLSLLQIKYQLSEDMKKTRRGLRTLERQFWKKYDLSSDKIQYVLDNLVGFEDEEEFIFGETESHYKTRINNVMKNYTYAVYFELGIDFMFSSWIKSISDKKHLRSKKTHKIKPMNSKQIKRTKVLPKKFSTKKQPCQAHQKMVNKRKVKNSYKFWKPICKEDGSYSTTDKICRKRRCWCVDDKGIFVKQILKSTKLC